MSTTGAATTYCTQCGEANAASDSFCTECGALLIHPTDDDAPEPPKQADPSAGPDEAASPPASIDSLPVSPIPPNPTRRPRSIKIPAIIGTMLIALLLGTGAAIFLVRSRTNETEPTATATPADPGTSTSPSQSALPSPTDVTTQTLYFRPEGSEAAEFVGIQVTGDSAQGYVAFPDTTYCFRGTIGAEGLTGKALVEGEVRSEWKKIAWPARGSGADFQLLSGPEEVRLIPTTVNGLPSFFTTFDPKKQFSDCVKSWEAGPRTY